MATWGALGVASLGEQATQEWGAVGKSQPARPTAAVLRVSQEMQKSKIWWFCLFVCNGKSSSFKCW